MKKIRFLLVLLTFVLYYLNAKSQYLPILCSGNQWNVQVVGCCPYVITEIYKIGDDTIISNQIWKSIAYTDDSSVNAIFNNRFYLREDSINKRLYVLDNNANSRLYFDFNLSLNDTAILFNPMFGNANTFVVVNVDSQYIGGKQRKKLKISSNSFLFMEDFWLEGIGSEKGIFYGNPSPSIGSVGVSLVCFSNYNQLIYQKEGFYDCYYSNVWIDETNPPTPRIYPNPATDFIQIENITIKTLADIYTIDGKLQKTLTLYNNTTIKINDLAEGIYIIKLQTEKGVIYRKIIKQ